MSTRAHTTELTFTFGEIAIDALRRHYGKMILAGFGATFAWMLYKLASVLPTL